VSVTGPEYVDLLARELAAVVLPDGPRRRSGPDSAFASSLAAVRDDVEATARMLRDGGLSREPAGAGADLAAETTSLLYAAGAPHPVWRHWAGLTSLGRILGGDRMDGCLHAVLGAEWGYAERLGTGDPPRAPLSMRVVWRLAAGGPGDPGADPSDEVDEAWLTLLSSVPAADHGRTEAALRSLAEFWMEEDEDWRRFHPRSYPDFQSDVCAAAQLARRRGYAPRDLDEDALEYLEPGLVEEAPEPLPAALSPFA